MRLVNSVHFVKGRTAEEVFSKENQYSFKGRVYGEISDKATEK